MKSSSILHFLSIAILITICLIGVVSVWIVIEIPRQAEISFGPPSKQLDFFKRMELSIRLLLKEDTLRKPADPGGLGQVFQIDTGESTFSITNRLEEAGLIQNANALRDYLVYSGMDTSLQAGKFEMSGGMTPIEIASALQDSTPEVVTFTILAGWRLEEIANSLPTSGLEFSPENYLFAASDPALVPSIMKELPQGSSLEGFLFPASYLFNRKISIEAFLETILQNFETQVDQQLRDEFANQGLTLYQAVILASIVQREAVLEEEMPTIASVFLNRLQIDMKLDSDPTVQYALGYNHSQKTWWKNPLSLEDLQVNSPYNTYQNAGLPPGPIANPGLAALKAIGNPAETSYLYFRSACDGSGKHVFSETFAQHQQNACP